MFAERSAKRPDVSATYRRVKADNQLRESSPETPEFEQPVTTTLAS